MTLADQTQWTKVLAQNLAKLEAKKRRNAASRRRYRQRRKSNITKKADSREGASKSADLKSSRPTTGQPGPRSQSTKGKPDLEVSDSWVDNFKQMDLTNKGDQVLDTLDLSPWREPVFDNDDWTLSPITVGLRLYL
jgi:hypothetical protein